MSVLNDLIQSIDDYTFKEGGKPKKVIMSVETYTLLKEDALETNMIKNITDEVDIVNDVEIYVDENYEYYNTGDFQFVVKELDDFEDDYFDEYLDDDDYEFD